MGSVDRSANKRGLHKIPSRLRAGSTGRPRAAMDAGETKDWRYLNRQTFGHGPPAHRNGKLGRRAAREGWLGLELGEISWARSTGGAVRAASCGNRPGPVEGRSAAKEERRLAS